MHSKGQDYDMMICYIGTDKCIILRTTRVRSTVHDYLINSWQACKLTGNGGTYYKYYIRSTDTSFVDDLSFRLCRVQLQNTGVFKGLNGGKWTIVAH